jgi:hypothetical protein
MYEGTRLDFGFLRGALFVVTVILIGIGPFSDGQVVLDSWRLLPSVVAPSLMLILIFVLPLDMTMARIFMSGAATSSRLRLRRIIFVEGALFIALVLAWIPFFRSVLRPLQ